MLLSAITCVFIRLYSFTTDFLLLTASPLRFLIACHHDITVTLMYNEIQSQHGQKSILIFQWRLTSENVNAWIVKNASITLGIRVAELGKCVAQTVISGCWATLRLRLNSLCYISKSNYKFWLYCPVFLYMLMFDILNTNGVSDYWYENDLDLIKAFYRCMSEYVPVLVRNVLKLLYMIQVFISK